MSMTLRIRVAFWVMSRALSGSFQRLGSSICGVSSSSSSCLRAMSKIPPEGLQLFAFFFERHRSSLCLGYGNHAHDETPSSNLMIKRGSRTLPVRAAGDEVIIRSSLMVAVCDGFVEALEPLKTTRKLPEMRLR